LGFQCNVKAVLGYGANFFADWATTICKQMIFSLPQRHKVHKEEAKLFLLGELRAFVANCLLDNPVYIQLGNI
jgi:hypothetical protein